MNWSEWTTWGALDAVDSNHGRFLWTASAENPEESAIVLIPEDGLSNRVLRSTIGEYSMPFVAFFELGIQLQNKKVSVALVNKVIYGVSQAKKVSENSVS